MPDVTLDLSNLGLEFDVIAYALQSGGLPDGLKAEHFAGQKSRWIAEQLEILGPTTSIPILISELNRQGRDDEVNEYDALLKRLVSQNVRPEQIPDAVDRIRELSTGRKLATVLSERGGVAEKLKTQKVKEAVRSLEQFLFAENLMQGIVNEGDLVSDAAELKAAIAVARMQEEFQGIATGIGPLDEVIYGLLPNEFGLISGGTGEGKSIALLDIGMRNYVWNQKNVLGFTIEMAKQQQQFRQLAWGCGIDIHKFRTGDITDEENQRIEKFLDELSGNDGIFHWVDIPENINAAQIEKKIIRAERKMRRDFELIVIDYLGIMSAIGRRGGQFDWDVMAEVSWNLHNLARKVHKAIWSAVQKKENISDAEKRKGGLKSIGLSYLIAQPADIVLIFTEKMLEGFMEINVAKGRDVPKKRVKLKPDMRHARLHRFDEPEPEEEEDDEES